MASFILTSLPMLVALLLTRNFDLIHIFFGVPSGPLGYVAKKLFGIPYLIRMGGGDVPGFRPFQYKYLYKILTPALNVLWRNADFLVANSHGLRDMAANVFPDLPIQIIPNGVDLPRFTSDYARCPAEEVRILFVSRLIRRKGLQFLIDAIPQIARQAKTPFVIKIVGDGPDMDGFVRQADELGVSRYLRFVGYVHHDKLPEYYLDADLFVLPSLAEGMANVVLEAIGSGLPVVATPVGGSEELIRQNENGVIVPTKDVNALADALIRLMNNRELREKMGRRSRQIAAHYSWEFVADAYAHFYERMKR